MKRIILALILLTACTSDLLYTPLPTEGNGQYYFEKENTPAVLVVHGLSATPWEVLGLSTYLAEHNLTVLTPVLAGHGRRPIDLEATTWQDWYANVQNSYFRLKARHDKVFVIGVSTGGSLALELAARENVSGVITIGAPITFRDTRNTLAKPLSKVWRYTDRIVLDDEQGHYYPVLMSKTVVQLNELIAATEESIPKVTAPVLLIQSKDDPTVDPSSAQVIYDALTTEDKQLLWLENVGHVVIREDTHGTTLANALTFIETH